MGNKLKNIFEDEAPEMHVNVLFENKESRKNFIESMNKALDLEENVSVNGIKGFDVFFQTSQGKHLIDSEENFVEFFVSPAKEKLPDDFDTIETDYGKFTFGFFRIHKQNEIIIKNAEDSVVHIRIEISLENQSVKFSFNPNFDNAKNIEEILKNYNAIIKLFSTFLKSSEEVKKHPTYIGLCNQEDFWKKTLALQDFLQISFNPSKINEATFEEDIRDIKELYLLIVKNTPVRRDLDNINDVIVSHLHKDLKMGEELFLSFTNNIRYDIWGTSFDIYRAFFIFHAKLEAIEETPNKQEYKLKLAGTDTKPLFCVYQGFLTKKEMKDKIESTGGKKEDELYFAKTLPEIIKDF